MRSRSAEVEIIRATVADAPGDPLGRRKWNVDGTLPATTPEEFWKWLTLSLTSSRQRYREGSPAWRLENDIDPFPLPLSDFGSLDESQIDERLKQFRFHQRITRQLLRNHQWLFSVDDEWNKTIQPLLTSLLEQRNVPPTPTHKELERKGANMLANKLKGIGPKQARNLLQSIGLTRYEIPLDSRLVDWLRCRLGWNIVIEALSRKDYYEDLLDRIQVSCDRAGVLPTLFDAAAFEEVGKAMTSETNPTTCTGYVNRNGQVVIRNTGAPGTDNNQYVYQLACSHCGRVYGENGSDLHERLCPRCQEGANGLAYE